MGPSGRVVRDGEGARLEFERTYDQPVVDVWAALTDPDRTARWFGPWSGDPASGSVQLVLAAEGAPEPQTVAIVECAAPTRLVVDLPSPDGTWRLAVEIAERGAGSALRFVHRLAEPYDASGIGPGWHWYLDRLGAVVAGEAVPEDWETYERQLSGAYRTEQPEDLAGELDRAARRVEHGDGHVVELRRVLPAPVEDVWAACTRPEQVSRWFLPVSGDLRPGGDYQLEGHAGGRVLECDPPHRLALTWVSGGTGSRVVVELPPRRDGTELVLRHALADDDHWRTYGAGATGVGWELALLGLARHLAGAPPVGDPAEFLARPQTQALLRASAGAWGDAEAASGTDPAVARERAARTAEVYAPTG